MPWLPLDLNTCVLKYSIMESNYKYCAFEVIVRLWESLDLKVNSQERKFPTDCSKQLLEKKLVNKYIWVSWIRLGIEEYMISTPYLGETNKQTNFSFHTENSTYVYCRPGIWCSPLEEMECSTLLPLLSPSAKWPERMLRPWDQVLPSHLI